MGLAWILGAAAAGAGEPMPDFHLADCNTRSPRYEAQVSPRDYLQRISAFFFAGAGCSYCREQFHYLEVVGTELQASNPPVSIEILGVNHLSYSEYNFYMPLVGTLPWLQDTAEEAVWSKWDVRNWDEVWILDSQNRLVSTYNLMTFNLALESNRLTLKRLLLDAARLVDNDGDGLPDDWELLYWGDLSHSAEEDADGDGFGNAVEYAFGSLPRDRESRPRITSSWGTMGGSPALNVTFRRRAGAALDYLVATSSDLRTWTPDAVLLIPGPLRQLYDGSGTAEAAYTLVCSPASDDLGFLRVEAWNRSRP